MDLLDKEREEEKQKEEQKKAKIALAHCNHNSYNFYRQPRKGAKPSTYIHFLWKTYPCRRKNRTNV